MIKALIVFCVMYIGMLAFSKYRVWFALGGALMMTVLGVISLAKIPFAINWNVLMMIIGTMGIVSLFIESKMPLRLADCMLKFTPNACWAIIALSNYLLKPRHRAFSQT